MLNMTVCRIHENILTVIVSVRLMNDNFWLEPSIPRKLDKLCTFIHTTLTYARVVNLTNNLTEKLE